MFSQGWEFIIAAFGPMGPFMVLGVLGAVLVLLSLPILFKKEPDPLDRLDGLAGGKVTRQNVQESPVRLRFDSGKSSLDKFAPYLEPQDQKEFSDTRMKMIQAGYRTRSAVTTFNFIRLVLGLSLLMLGLISVFLRSDEPGLASVIISVLVPGAIGYFAPNYWVERRRQQRQEDVTNGFPDALDLMLVCVEAGQSLDQAILRVSQEIRGGYPTLAEEFEIVSHEMRAGKDRVTVLRDMGERCGVADISAFVTVLVQSATFGTSIADALRVYASEMRDKRVMRAEEKANKLPTKLTLGTMMFTVPPLLIILVGPSMYDIYVNLLGGGQ
ncbi:type II secretion system F family protein [Oceanomicrobium pacificus]|uniref:Type II secretion system F family protein n=1 Tax=Oceanomicrobium pacificus TaxID=2692916 RepID=A0A6B0TVS6_9RHOB|nr:type II secretion system F family protein [Oceanomicrobium pacificus]MXU65332.1 type II secretion system F family protein [Oceanomicrobium pacificus]